MCVCRASQLQPLLVLGSRLRGVHGHITLPVTGLCWGNPHGLMPAVLARDRIWVHCMGEILMDSDIRPPHPQRIRVGRFEWAAVLLRGQLPLGAFLAQSNGHHAKALPLMPFGLPPTHVMTARHHTRTNALGDPRLENEVAEICGDPCHVSCLFDTRCGYGSEPAHGTS